MVDVVEVSYRIVLATIEEGAVIEWILRHLGLPTERPTPSPARAPPLDFEAA